MTTARELGALAEAFIHKQDTSTLTTKQKNELKKAFKAGWMAGYGDLITSLQKDKEKLESQLKK